ncbi:MAG: hypothetical protein EXR36_13630 [Betaproteobacteria bacterium]|nr:hypothetical protein [Betaproteobacteria bacterium]
MPLLFHDLTLAAQTAYAEVFEQARTLDLMTLPGLTGAFHRRTIKWHEYIYFGYRDPTGTLSVECNGGCTLDQPVSVSRR